MISGSTSGRAKGTSLKKRCVVILWLWREILPLNKRSQMLAGHNALGVRGNMQGASGCFQIHPFICSYCGSKSAAGWWEEPVPYSYKGQVTYLKTAETQSRSILHSRGPPLDGSRTPTLQEQKGVGCQCLTARGQYLSHWVQMNKNHYQYQQLLVSFCSLVLFFLYCALWAFAPNGKCVKIIIIIISSSSSSWEMLCEITGASQQEGHGLDFGPETFLCGVSASAS